MKSCTAGSGQEGYIKLVDRASNSIDLWTLKKKGSDNMATINMYDCTLADKMQWDSTVFNTYSQPGAGYDNTIAIEVLHGWDIQYWVMYKMGYAVDSLTPIYLDYNPQNGCSEFSIKIVGECRCC